MKIKKGDTVEVITGKDRGRRGKVERALPREQRVVVSGLNLVRKHKKSRGQEDPGGIIEMPAPVHVSNVMLVCPKCGLKTRVGHQISEGVKKRICRECEQEV